MAQRDVLQLGTLAELKACPVSPGARVFLAGKNAVGDNLGGFYRWDEAATGAEDAAYMNIVPSSRSATGRWRRIFVRNIQYPHGVLTFNGGIKTFYASGVTNANSDIMLYLTEDNTPAGAALFTEIWSNVSRSTATANGPSSAVQSYTKSLSADLKQTTHGYYKANALTITLGLVYAPFASVGAGIPAQFEITGV